MVLPGGDLVVAYETAREDIYFKRGPFERLATAAERPVAISQREMEKFPFVVRSGTRLVFFWMSADRHDPRPLWRVRVRTYTPAWTEAEASWGPAHDLSQTGTFLEEGPGPDPDAAPDQFGELVDLYLVRHHPVTGWGEPFPGHRLAVQRLRAGPCARPRREGRIWLFWSDANRGDSQGDLFFKQLGTSM